MARCGPAERPVGPMSIASIGLALVAGLLSSLSPCVLPLLPVVLTTAASEHRLAPLALAGGLGLSFAAIGLFVGTVGIAIGLDTGVFRGLAAAMLIAVGVVLASPALQERLAVAAGPVSGWADKRLGGFSTTGIAGQFGVGLLLGAVWSPCVGPTLGAAALLASQGRDLAQAAVVMGAFGLGAALPLLILGLLSREAMLRLKGGLLGTGRRLRPVLGVLLVLVGIGILSGLDKRLEAALVAASPEWLTRLTTLY